MCAHTGKDCRIPTDGHQKYAVWCNKMSGSEQNCTWKFELIPASKTNAEEIKTSNTYALLCSSIVDPPQHATIIAKSDSVTSNNYWRTEEISLLTNVKNTRDVLTVQLPNNNKMSAKRIGNTPLARSLSNHTKKAHIFDGLHSSSLIYLGQLCDYGCISILDKNEINILKGKHLS